MVYVIQVCGQLASRSICSSSQAVSKPVWQWKTPDDGERNWPKYVEFHYKNKFEKTVHLVGFILNFCVYLLVHCISVDILAPMLCGTRDWYFGNHVWFQAKKPVRFPRMVLSPIFMWREKRIISEVYLFPFPTEKRDRHILRKVVGFLMP